MSAHRSTWQRLLLTAAAILIGVSGARAQTPPPDAVPAPPDGVPVPPAGSISGTLQVNGCTPAPGDIVLKAMPMVAGGLDGRSVPTDLALPTGTAAITSTRNPHAFEFTVNDLRPSTLYRLRIGFRPPNPCGPVFWRAAGKALVVAGASVALEGFAARTQVEVLDLRTGDGLGADDLRFTDPTRSRRTFRWRTTLADIVGGEIQVSTEAFPTKGAFGPCDEPRGGIIYRQSVPVRPGEWAQLPPLNFTALLRPTAIPGVFARPSPVSPDVYRRLLAGFPLYVRVIPRRADGPACSIESDGVDSTVVFAKLPGKTASLTVTPTPVPVPHAFSAGEEQGYLPPYVGGPAEGHPTFFETAYKVTKPHTLPNKDSCIGVNGTSIMDLLWAVDPLGCNIVAANMAQSGAILGEGSWFFFGPPPSSSDDGGLSGALSFVASSLGALVTGTINAVGMGVNAVADMIESIKSAIATGIVDVIGSVEPFKFICDNAGPDNCKKVVQAGLEAGMVAMGLPPSLPNWEQLKDQGIDYLAAEIASETGAPAELTEPILKALVKQSLDKMSEQQAASNGPGYDWVVPYLGFDPAVWTLTVVKNTTATFANTDVLRQENALFLGGEAPLPEKFPSTNTLHLPLVLQPNLSGIKAPYCVADLVYQVKCTPAVFSTTAKCYYTETVPGLENIGKTQLQETPCSMTDWPAIYYRDTWTSQKFDATPCVSLRAWSVLDFFGLVLPFPFPALSELARVRPPFEEHWNGPFFVAPGCVF